MERDVRYLLVGAVVIALVGGFIGLLFWQADRIAVREGERYTVLSEHGVSGLEVGGVVRYLGVRVGQVQSIRLSREFPDHVELDILVEPHVPMTRATRASVRPEGIIGQSYVALRTPDPDAEAPESRPGVPHPVIRSERSELDRLFEDIPQLVQRVGSIAESLEGVLDEENREQFARMLANIGDFTAELDRIAASIEQVAERAVSTLEGAETTLADLGAAARAAEPALEEAGRAGAAVRQLSDRLELLVERNEAAVERFTRDGLEDAQRLLRDARRTANQLEQLALRLGEEPSRLIHRRPVGGVEIPH